MEPWRVDNNGWTAIVARDGTKDAIGYSGHAINSPPAVVAAEKANTSERAEVA